ncbi:antiterminator LoaP [Paenibacillus sp. MSJ-34]|uniref:antiterminator LoaP n=1 Tax=Paenibacillus sp. MSJ-34 TaxID=2841529 RepID=UPI0034612E5A
MLHVLTGEELNVKKRLERSAPHIQTLIPRRKLMERRQGSFKEVTRLLFPGYVFVYTVLDHESYYKLVDQYGVIRILGRPDPCPVPLQEMAHVLKWCEESELVGMSRVQDGEKVTVIDGPLKNMEGQIVRVDRRKGRARVRITLFGEPKEIDFGIDILDKAPE